MRFVGQAFELPVHFESARIDDLTVADFLQGFEAAHQRMFYHGIGSGRAVEIVSLRVGAILPVRNIPQLRIAGSRAKPPATHPVFAEGNWVECRHLAGDHVKVGEPLDGPTIIEGSTATTYIPQGWHAELDQANNLILRKVS
jgi:N-methylhydantoinase A